jgi:hypothetical protein
VSFGRRGAVDVATPPRTGEYHVFRPDFPEPIASLVEFR